MPKELIGATMKEAKKRLEEHTRSVLNDWAREELKKRNI